MHDADPIDFSLLAPWIRSVREARGEEHVLLTDGWRHIRIDVEQGSVLDGGPVRLHYGMARAPGGDRELAPVRRLLALWDQRRFCSTLYPPDPRARRLVDTLRASDALRAGASQREIARALYGSSAADQGWGGQSDATRSKVRRVIRDAQAMLSGGFRRLMR